MNFDQEFMKLVNEMGKNFRELKIQSFLQCHHRISQLFTTKIQAFIDGKGNIKQEINFNMDAKTLKEIETFNANMSKLSEIKEDKSDGLQKKVK